MKKINILCVEDGSVDVESLEDEGLHDGKVLIYRQGATPPFVLKLKTDDGEFKSEQSKVAVEKLEELFKKVRQVVIVTDVDNTDYSTITLWGLKEIIKPMIKELKGEK
jgi:hypothetical protein